MKRKFGQLTAHVLPRDPLVLARYWLVGMHVTASLAQAAGVAKYVTPVSDISCRVTARAAVALVLLYDVSKLSIDDVNYSRPTYLCSPMSLIDLSTIYVRAS